MINTCRAPSCRGAGIPDALSWTSFAVAAAFLGSFAQWIFITGGESPRSTLELLLKRLEESLDGSYRSSSYLLAFPLACVASAWLLRSLIRAARKPFGQLCIGVLHLLLSLLLLDLLWILEISIWQQDGAGALAQFLLGIVIVLPFMFIGLPYRFATEMPGGWLLVLVLAPLYAWVQVVVLRALVPSAIQRERMAEAPR